MIYCMRMGFAVKNVYILTNASKCSGRDILQGFLSAFRGLSFARLHIAEMSDYGIRSLCNAIASGGVDGLVTSELEDRRLVSALSSSTFPLVVIGARKQTLPDYSGPIRVVTSDEVELAAFATQYLLSCGRFASYGFVHFREEFCRHLSALRAKGFGRALQDRGIRPLFYESDLPEVESDLAPLQSWLLALPRPAAILAGYDRRAADVIEACALAKLRIPSDVCVLGIDNDEIICTQTTPRLTSIAAGDVAEGKAAARQLIALMRRHKAIPRRETTVLRIQPKVIERDSTRMLAPGAALVRRGLEFICSNASSPISVNDVINHLRVSRRLAYLRFEEFAHQTIKRSILDARLALVKRKLASTRQTIDALSRSCGFENPNNLKVIFRRETGMTMSEWRAQNSQPRGSKV